MNITGTGDGNNYLKGTPTFNFANITTDPVTPSPISEQSVHIQTGTWGCSDATTTVSISPLRQLPNCALQKVTVVSGQTMRHEVKPPAGAHIDRYEHILLNVNGTRAPCLVVDARTSYGRIAYIAMYMTTDVAFNGASTLEEGTGVVNSMTLGATGLVEVLHCVLHGDYTGTFLSPDTPQVSLQAREVAQQAFALCAGNASQLRSVNTQRWAALWRAQLEVLPNNSTDVEIQKLNKVLQMCMYRLFASTVDSTHIGNNVTRNIKPSVEFMTASLVTLKAAMMLDTFKNFTVSPIVRTSALALYIINAWSVFRSTLDRVWLGDIMPIITKSMDEITSRIQISGMDIEEEVSGVGPTVGRLGQPLEDDAYTTILVKNALEMSIQASYELRMFPRQEWKKLNDTLQMPVSGALIQATTATGIAAVNPEHIINLHPYYYRQTLGTPVNVLTINKTLADTAVANADPVLKAAGIAVLTSYLPFVSNSSDRADQLDALLVQFYALRDLPASEWGFLGEDQSLDTISSIVSCVVYGFARTRITGQVSVDGIHTERASVALSRTASMPRTWKAVKIKSATLLAPENLTVNIIV
jgi:hypothetical protein